MSETSTLDALIAAVENGRLPEAVFHGHSVIRGRWAYATGLSASQRTQVYLAYTGSLDAALALHEALLPGRYWQLEQDDDDDGLGFWATVCSDGCVGAAGVNPARAWLLAILKAYRAQASA
jgi:hypothetical protein